MKASLLVCTALLYIPTGSMIAADTISDAFSQGKVSLNVRGRYESAAQTGLKDSDAITLRTRLGFTTTPLHGWKAMLEAENVVAVEGDSYNQAGLNPGGAGRVVIADPETTEINQAWLAWSQDQTTATLGRQRLVLDNHRFVGDVGWRQNMQTFDALAVKNTSLDQTTLTYAYLDQINRVFGDRHAQGKWKSDSHVFNGSYTGYEAGTLTAYAYLLDFKGPAAANSCATFGASFAGSHKLTDSVKLAYRAEYATQSDYGSSPLNYSAHYLGLESGFVFKSGSLSAGYEVLGSDRNVGFKTPLATLHAFNGWADLFLGTPAAGLRDTYAKVTANLPGELALLAFYHRFETDRGTANLGHETDIQLSRKLTKATTLIVKYADFNRGNSTFPDVTKFWLQVEFVY